MNIDEEAELAVSELNDDIADTMTPEAVGDHQLWFSYSSNGWVSCVDFLGVTLWDSDNDGTIYSEEEGKDEEEIPLIDHLRVKAKEMIAEANRVFVDDRG